MTMFDIHSKIEPSVALAPGSVSSDTNTAGIDTQGFEALELMFTFGTTVQAGTTIKLQESDDNSAWADVADDGTNNYGVLADSTVSPAANVAIGLGYVGNKRYVRGVVETTGATLVAVTSLASYLDNRPGQKVDKVPAASLT